MSRLRALLDGPRATALRAALGRLRPTGRFAAAKVALLVGGLVVVLGLAVVLSGAAVAIAYDQFGFHPERNALSWAALAPRYADGAPCSRCHAPQEDAWSASNHRTVSCQVCHGPLAAHAAETSPGAPAGSVTLPRVPEGICATCHERVLGRPKAVPQVALAEHYPEASCTWCHDPHHALAVRPPDISHPLDRLPACTTCHRPAGLKPLPVGHEEAPDQVCRACHLLPATGSLERP